MKTDILLTGKVKSVPKTISADHQECTGRRLIGSIGFFSQSNGHGKRLDKRGRLLRELEPRSFQMSRDLL